VTPISFTVRVRDGISLSQLRLFYGMPQHCEIRGKELYDSVLLGGGFPDGSLSVDLSDARIANEEGCAFCASSKRRTQPINLWYDKKQKPDPRPDPKRLWKFLSAEKQTAEPSKKYLQIAKEAFYILRSKEKISLPAGIAVYCRAIDETIGEMRIHYAGFVHPLFGRERNDRQRGTPLIFEVRGHDVSVTLSDGEKMASLIFYRMSENARADKEEQSGYGSQTLQLSNFFRPWK